MTPQFRTFLKIILWPAGLFGATWLVLSAAQMCARPLVKYVDRCEMPCVWSDGGFHSCRPLKANLEIRSTPEPSGRGKAIWYRASVANQSCRVIALDEHFYSRNDWRRFRAGSFLTVTGPDGRPAPVPDSADSAITDITNPNESLDRSPIIPYRYNSRDVAPSIVQEKPLPGDRQLYYHLQLLPGQEIAASFSELFPTRLKFFDVETKDYFGSAIGPVPVPMAHPEMKFALPPPGFRRLNEFDLRRPGRYKAQFVVDDRGFAYRYEDPRRPYRNFLRGVVHFFARDGASEYFQGFVQFNAKSDPVEIDISR